VLRVLADEALRSRIRQNGLSFAQSTDWITEGKKVIGVLDQMIDGAVETPQ
jgi:hypothetical protein